MTKGFTLAEVLITLAIIGVVAALTIPTLTQSHQEKVTVTKLKKIYSVIEQAYLQAVNEYGTPEDWDLVGADSPEGAVHILERFAPYLKIIKNCGNGPGCFPDLNYGGLKPSYTKGNVNNFRHVAKVVLGDGMSAYFQAGNDCEQVMGPTQMLSKNCGAFVVDINGFKPPNQQGVDLFFFYISKYGIVPAGTKDDNIYSFSSTCNFSGNGAGCTAWVIYNENLDYLHCNDLAWGGKTKCK